jgi:hypothetical protein
MDFVRAITFPFDDDDWPVKLIVGALLSFIPFFAQGYQVRVARNVIRGRKNPLPGTDEIGEVFIDGLMATIAALIYFLPIILVACVFFFPAVILGESDLGGLAACGAACCVPLVILLYILPAGGMYVMGIIHYGETGNFSAFMQIGTLWRDVRANLGTLLMLLVYSLVLGFLGTLVSFTVVIIPFLGFFYHIATGHLIGQAGLEIQEADYYA